MLTIVKYIQDNQFSDEALELILSEFIAGKKEKIFKEGYDYCLDKMKKAKESKAVAMEKSFQNDMSELRDFIAL